MHLRRSRVELAAQFFAGDELDIFFDKVQAGFQVCEQLEQLISQTRERRSQPTGKLGDGDVQLVPVA